MKAIPTWKQRKLDKLAYFSKGSGYSKKDLIPYGYPIILYGRLYTKYETVIQNVDTYVNKKEKSIISNGNEVIVPASGESAEDISRASVVANSGMILGGDLNIITLKEKIEPVFLALTISNGKQKKELRKRAQGKSVVHLHNSDLKEVNLICPSKEEQKKISELFRTLENSITLHQEKLSKLQSLKKAALQSLFPQKNEKEPKVRFANFKEIWKQYKLKDVIESELKGKAKAKDKTNDCKNVYLETNYLNGGEVSYVDVPNDVDEDDVLILWDGSQAGTVYHGYKGALGSTLKAYKPKESGEFMFQYLKKNQQKIYDNYRTPNIPHVVKTFTEDFRIKSTSIIEQRKISSFFKQLDSTINFYQDKLEKLQLLKKAFLQKMFI
ncbi:restriction endonuclease subunit S [Tetragenococcus halophilus]|uniref:restriction endonuclease subunit S n=1 Tax=Tetragenococcus halophilus TaxID=51669 RepID=UPI0030F1F4E1